MSNITTFVIFVIIFPKSSFLSIDSGFSAVFFGTMLKISAAKAKTKRKSGRPSKYKPEYCDQATRLARLGLVNDELAEALGIGTTTFDVWLVVYPEFKCAIKEGRESSDAKVAESLYKKALSGDTTACIFWLKNRRRMSWRDKSEVTHTVGGIGDLIDELHAR